MSKEYRRLLEKAFPEAVWPILTRGAGEAITIADKVRLSTPFLATRVGGDLRGLMRRAALMWRFNTLCKSKELPFEAEEIANPYTNGTSHLLRILSNKIELHIVRTDEAEKFPIDAQIRQDHRASNEPDLFRDGKLIPLHEALDSVPSLYGWIMWGATPRGELTHFALGMPDKKKDVWLTYIDVLARVKKTEAAPGATTEKSSKPNPALLLKFREEIARSLEQESSEQDETGNESTG
jgi:hypothetical protein